MDKLSSCVVLITALFFGSPCFSHVPTQTVPLSKETQKEFVEKILEQFADVDTSKLECKQVEPTCPSKVTKETYKDGSSSYTLCKSEPSSGLYWSCKLPAPDSDAIKFKGKSGKTKKVPLSTYKKDKDRF